MNMNSIGTWYDNAAMESFFGSLKSALVVHQQRQTPVLPGSSNFVTMASNAN